MTTINQISPKGGKNTGGICSVEIADINLLSNIIKISPFSSTVTSEISLLAGAEFLKLKFMERTYEYNEVPKDTKAGPYYEISLTGNLDHITPEIQNTLAEYTFKKIFGIIQFSNGDRKLIGNKDAGLDVRSSIKNVNDNSGGFISINIQITGNQLTKPPFYLI